MSLEKYQALLSAIDHGTLSAAATALGYTTSGISRMIASLETETGFPLLIRQKSGVTATSECQQLLPHIRDIVYAEEKYRQAISDLNGLLSGSITIGTSIDSYFPLLSRIVAAFSEKYPGIHVNIIENRSSELGKAIQERRADFCIMSKRPGDFHWIPLKEDQLVALIPKNHKYAKLKSFPLNALSEEPFIDIYHEAETDNSLMFARNGIHPNYSFACSNCFAAATMIEVGLGITLENELIAERWSSNIKILPLDPPQYVEIGIAVPDETSASPAAKCFMDFAKGFVQ